MIRKNFISRKRIKMHPVKFGIVALCTGILVAFLTFVTVGLVNQKAELLVVTTYKLPEAKSLEALNGISEAAWAVAVDGEVVAGADFMEPKVRPTASTAKMILGLMVMEEKPFSLGEKGETITISEDDYGRYLWYVRNGGSNSRVKTGEEISEYDALSSVFLPSSNNMADTLAIWAFGSLDNYREYATEKLSEWGIVDTTIGVDASGFDESTTSTPEDLARIGAKVLENPVLREIVGLKSADVPVAGTLENTNKLLGEKGIIGVKTGFIGEPSGYCLVSGYMEKERVVTVALLNAPTREKSFSDSLLIVESLQEVITETPLVAAGDVVGYYDSWWTGKVEITSSDMAGAVTWENMDSNVELLMDGKDGALKLTLAGENVTVRVEAGEYNAEPSFVERFLHLFGWKKTDDSASESAGDEISDAEYDSFDAEHDENDEEYDVSTNSLGDFLANLTPVTEAPTENCTKKYGYLMLVNPNFKVENDFIAARKEELISVSATYGILEFKASNGDNLMDEEAAKHLDEMLAAYTAENPGHTMGTRSCFRMKGTSCGRLCAATGESDHHTGLTCDLIDTAYGTELDTDDYAAHPEWQWLKANSYRYGFIDRFPEEWAGGSMSEPLNVDENGSTGLFETWHYRYVGVEAATEIATGKYNDGRYDSLEHYLLATGLVVDLKNAICAEK